MKTIESGKDKVKKICDALRRETLEPAEKDAEEIIAKAHLDAEKILSEARQESERLVADAEGKIEKERAVFQSTLQQASKQSVQYLKQMIEEKLFNSELRQLLSRPLADPKILSDLIAAVVTAIEKEGIDTDLSVYIPAAVPPEKVNALLGRQIMDKLKEKSVLLSSIGGGIEVKLKQENITLDLTEATLRELMASYMRKDFRELFFGETQKG